MMKFRILPVTIAGAAVIFALKAGLFVFDVRAFAQSSTEDHQVSSEAAEPANPASPQAGDAGRAEAQNSPPAANIPLTDPLLMNRSELELLQELSARREELERRSGQIQMREKLLEATEQRLDEKIARLESIESRIKALVAVHEEGENAQLQSIVKVYETMKPKSAAPILERLDMRIQLEVATRMKESKMAPILAAMSEEGAKALTVELATRARMPKIDG